jgi:hypothetical protein
VIFVVWLDENRLMDWDNFTESALQSGIPSSLSYKKVSRVRGRSSRLSRDVTLSRSLREALSATPSSVVEP